MSVQHLKKGVTNPSTAYTGGRATLNRPTEHATMEPHRNPQEHIYHGNTTDPSAPKRDATSGKDDVGVTIGILFGVLI